jgi:hypothetical protein
MAKVIERAKIIAAGWRFVTAPAFDKKSQTNKM